MSEEYEPELGQMFFGQSSQELECPDYVDAALEFLATLFYNKRLSDKNPFRNTGWCWGNDVFGIQAYSWDDEREQNTILNIKI